MHYRYGKVQEILNIMLQYNSDLAYIIAGIFFFACLAFRPEMNII